MKKLATLDSTLDWPLLHVLCYVLIFAFFIGEEGENENKVQENEEIPTDIAAQIKPGPK